MMISFEKAIAVVFLLVYLFVDNYIFRGRLTGLIFRGMAAHVRGFWKRKNMGRHVRRIIGLPADHNEILKKVPFVSGLGQTTADTRPVSGPGEQPLQPAGATSGFPAMNWVKPGEPNLPVLDDPEPDEEDDTPVALDGGGGDSGMITRPTDYNELSKFTTMFSEMDEAKKEELPAGTIDEQMEETSRKIIEKMDEIFSSGKKDTRPAGDFDMREFK